MISDTIRLLRPKQWLKNGFVLAGVVFGGYFRDVPLLIAALLATLAFCFVSSAVYILNDIFDVEYDRNHQSKKQRPIASGKISIPYAQGLFLVMGALGLGIGITISWHVVACLVAYILLNIAYSTWLKQVVILDVFCISGGFMLRVLAGTIGLGIPPSRWLLLCSMMLTLFLGFTKRRAELMHHIKKSKDETRQVLGNYGPVLLDEMIGICATGVIISYSLYTMNLETITVHKTENLIYTVPFVIYGLFRYIYILHHRNGGEDPSHDVIDDPHIYVSIGLWGVLTLWLMT